MHEAQRLRRRFLRQCALGAAAALPGSLLAGGMKMPMPSPAAASAGNALCRHPVADQSNQPRLLEPASLRPFVDPLPLPQRLRPSGPQPLRITMRETEQRLHSQLPPTRVWTYGGQLPGPLIEAQRGHELSVIWKNELPHEHFLPIDHNIHGAEVGQPAVRSVVHLHGARVGTASDGYPDDWYLPGQQRLHRYPNQQDAATLWYHDHAMGINRLNIYAGLFGMLWLRDDHEASLGLPRDAQELPLVLCDRLLTEQGQLYYSTSGVSGAPWVPEVFGNLTLVNGAIQPYLDVQPRRYRLRVLNAANGRFFHLSLRGRRPFQQIGSDQGLLAAPVSLDSLLLAPGERADLVIDFASLKGQRIELMNDALPVMQFRVGHHAVEDRSKVPARLREVPRIPPRSASRTRLLTLDEYADCVAEPMLMLLDGKRWHEPVSEKPRLGSTEIWSLLNLTEDTHPIHLHLVRFQILDRRSYDADAYLASKQLRFTGPAQPPPAHELGWKDTVQAYPGMLTRIIIRFDGYVGRYAWHCHLLEHEANEMMRPFEVIPA